MSDLTIALAGGAIGSVLTAGTGLSRRLLAVPSDVARNDFEAAERNDDLETWVADEDRLLRQAMAQKASDLASAGQQQSGSFGASMAILKSLTLHRYRDQERQGRRDLAAIRSREDWLHRLYRRATRRRDPSLHGAERVQPVLDSWRSPAKQADGTAVPVYDPTQHTIVETIQDLRTSAT